MRSQARKIKRFHVRPCIGPRRPIEHEKLFMFFAANDLPDPAYVAKTKISFAHPNLAISSQQGMPAYLEELTDSGWIACKMCARGASCMSMEGIESLMEGIPVGILIGNTVVGDPVQLMKLGLAGPNLLRGAVFAFSAFSVMLDEAKRFFGSQEGARPIQFEKEPADYARDLGIRWPASRDEVEQAFKKMAFKYHPDRNPDDRSAEQRFKSISEARRRLLKELENR